MQITALAGGVGGARFLRGLRAHLDASPDPDLRSADITVIGNTGDDITLFGLRVCPDLDTVMYTLGGGIDEQQGWGRADETHSVQGELAAYGVQPQWFGLGDRDFATHIARSQLLDLGYPLSQVTEVLCARWGLPDQRIRLLPMSDDPVETHVVIDREPDRPGVVDGAGGADQGAETQAIHFQEWWVRLRAAVPARQIVALGIESARPGPDVLQSIRDADVILLPPSNPVVSIGIILGVPEIRETLRGTRAPVVGVSPLVGGRPVRGHADACLAAIGVESTTAAVAGLYADFLDGWLVDSDDLPAPGQIDARVSVRARPLLMHDVEAAADIAGAALDLALGLRATTPATS